MIVSVAFSMFFSKYGLFREAEEGCRNSCKLSIPLMSATCWRVSENGSGSLTGVRCCHLIVNHSFDLCISLPFYAGSNSNPIQTQRHFP